MMVPIVNKLKQAYPAATTDNINFMAMSFMICISVDNPICAWFTERFGLKYALWLGCGACTVGGILKSFINDDYTYLIVGQTIIAIFFPLFYINESKLSANWFPKHERIYSTMVGMLTANFGCSFGFIFPDWFVPRASTNPSVEEIKSSIQKMLNYLWIFQVVQFVIMIIFFKERALPSIEPEEMELLETDEPEEVEI
jgi:MFS family permease